MDQSGGDAAALAFHTHYEQAMEHYTDLQKKAKRMVLESPNDLVSAHTRRLNLVSAKYGKFIKEYAKHPGTSRQQRALMVQLAKFLLGRTQQVQGIKFTSLDKLENWLAAFKQQQESKAEMVKIFGFLA